MLKLLPLVAMLLFAVAAEDAQAGKLKLPKFGASKETTEEEAVETDGADDLADKCSDAAHWINIALDDVTTEPGALSQSVNSRDKVLKLPSTTGMEKYAQVWEKIDQSKRGDQACGDSVEKWDAALGRIAEYASYLAGEIPKVLDGVWRLQQDGDLVGAVKEAEMAVALAQVGTSLDSGNEEMAAALVSAEARRGEAMAAWEKSLSGPFHAEHLGQVVLFSVPTAPGKESADRIATSWRAGEPMYAVGYFMGSLNDMAGNPGGDARMEVAVFDPGSGSSQAIGHSHRTIDVAAAGATAYAVELWPADVNSPADAALALKMGEMLLQLPPRVHELEIRILASDPRDGGRTTGRFDPPASAIRVDTSDTEALRAAVATLREVYTSKQRMPKAKKTDAALSAQMMKAYSEAGWEEKTLRAVILESDWTYFHDEWNAIVSRTIRGTVAVQSAGGACTMYDGIFQQDALGGGKYSAATLNLITSDRPISCGNVSK